MNIGIVGAGRSALNQARSLIKYADVQITAVAEPARPSRDAFARLFDAKLAVSDHRRLASDPSVDVVCICSPPATHSAIAIDCLQAGKHVICLPPIAITVQQADEMLAASEATKQRLMVSLPHRYDPLNQRMAQMIESDEIGYPFLALASFVENQYHRLNDWHDWKGTWDVGGGGILMDRGSEMIDLLRFCFGEVEAVSAVCNRFAIEALNKAEDTSLMDLEFLAEISAQLALTGAAQFSAWPETYNNNAMRIQVYGVEGSIEVTNVDRQLVLSTRKNRHRVIPVSEISTVLPTDMNRDMLDSIIQGKEPLATAVHARDALRVVVAAYKSSQMKRRVETLEQL